MIKRVALLLLILLLSSTVPVLAAEPGSGIIEGQVINGTADGSSVTDQDIALNIYLNDTEVDSITTRTDADGYFVFDSLSLESGYYYQVKITFQQADYNSEQISFADDSTSKYIEIAVYDATTSDEAIKVSAAHTIAYVEQGILQVMEYFFFVNEADRTYIGSKEINDEGTRQTLMLPLPDKATGLRPEYGLMECCIFNSEGGFIDTMPVLPGGKEVIYSYSVDYNSGEYTFSRKMDYALSSYDLFVQGDGSNVDSDQLIIGDPLNIEGTPFQHLYGQGLAPGETVVARFSRLPDTNNQMAFIWVASVLIVLSGGFGLNYLLRQRRLQPVKVSGNAQKQRLLVGLARIDDDFENGKIEEGAYKELRAEKKEQLMALMNRLKEKSGTG